MRKIVALGLSALLAWSCVGPANAADSVPVFLKFSSEDCVRDPSAVFSIPESIAPLGFVSHVTPLVTFGWSIWTKESLLPGARTFEVPLKSRSNLDKISFLRTAFTYQTSPNTPGPSVFSPPLEIPANLHMMDSDFCVNKRKQDAENARLAQLPNFKPVELKYLGTSHILLDFARADSNPSKSIQYEFTNDGVSWSAIKPFSRQPSQAATPSNIAVGFVVPSGSLNVTAIRLRGVNASGTGSWLEVSTGRPAGSSRFVVADQYTSEGYVLTTNPILLPNPDLKLKTPPSGCSSTTVELSELSSKGIIPGDSFRIETALEDGAFRNNLAYSKGLKTIPVWESSHNPERASFNVLLCPVELEFSPRYLRVKVTRLSDNSTIEGRIEVLQQPLGEVERAKAAAEALCTQPSSSGFGTNITIEQTKIQKADKAQGTLRGTIFRAGFVAPNQRYFVYLASSKSTKALAQGKTDLNGQFEFSFSLPTGKAGTSHRIFIVVDDASGASVPFTRIVESSQTPIDLIWGKNGLTYGPSKADWIPVHAGTCAQAFASIPQLFEDDRNSVAWFIAKRVYYGMKDKPSKSTSGGASPKPSPGTSAGNGTTNTPSYGSTGSIGKRCWVNGYTTKSGKRVSGYYRRC